jgi:hypothetical protein
MMVSRTPKDEAPGELERSLKSTFENENKLRGFLKDCALREIRGEDFERIVLELPVGGPFAPGDHFSTANELYSCISSSQQNQLKNRYFELLNGIASKFPSFILEFPTVFSRMSRS